MTVDTEKDLQALRRIGRICAQALAQMHAHLAPGITTAELDAIGAEFLRNHGARSAPRLVYNFPGDTCISVNDEAAHGIPGERRIQPGDLVNLDVSAELDGYFADTAATYLVPPVSPQAHLLVETARKALQDALAVAKAGAPLSAIGRAIENRARRNGFTTLRELGGHGVGLDLHEEPHNVPTYDTHLPRPRLTEGLVITIEPFVTTGARRVHESPNGWTLHTGDGGLYAQFEHTLLITRGRPLILTTAN
jgi:methionyl aminopeptidase